VSSSCAANAESRGSRNISLNFQALEFREEPGVETVRRDVVEIAQDVIERGPYN